jgi:hypothetical protein
MRLSYREALNQAMPLARSASLMMTSSARKGWNEQCV